MAKHYTCQECGSKMVHEFDNFYVCKNCGWSASVEFLEDGNDDYIYAQNRENQEEIPECCAACGGPYPKCMSSCKIFDD